MKHRKHRHWSEDSQMLIGGAITIAMLLGLVTLVGWTAKDTPMPPARSGPVFK